eukprot:TRINITY_DN5026_c0_g1_i1.p1 TRINITY_DN5026_c0_g1~~TRINITY_DN5026_c0_g1_i1.p1  ORF type:complete len:204 (+),score=23.89 TRINITY_DN5026_c0_g1_i1:57-668(+)
MNDSSGALAPGVKKVVVVGDGAVGKTCLLMCYSGKPFNPQYAPTIFDNYTTEVDLPEGGSVMLSLWDTAGQEEYDRIRIMSYVNVDCFVVCFTVADQVTYGNVKERWIPEIKRYSPETPYILVGTKEDLRTEDEELPRGQVSYDAGRALKAEIGAQAYLECSSTTQNGVKAVFDAAIKVVTAGNKGNGGGGGAGAGKKRCALF